jgi:hypothetical protein
VGCFGIACKGSGQSARGQARTCSCRKASTSLVKAIVMSQRQDNANHLSNLLNSESCPEESGNSPCKNLPARFHKRCCGATIANLTMQGRMHAPQGNIWVGRHPS